MPRAYGNLMRSLAHRSERLRWPLSARAAGGRARWSTCVRATVRCVLCSVEPLHCLSSDCGWLGSFEWRRCSTIASRLLWPAHVIQRAQLACRTRATPYESTQSPKVLLVQ